MFHNPKAKLSPRIERVVMKMQNLDFAAVYAPGKTNMTDYLSRHVQPETVETEHESHVRAVVKLHHAVKLETIKKGTKEDPILQQVKESLFTGSCNNLARHRTLL